MYVCMNVVDERMGWDGMRALKRNETNCDNIIQTQRTGMMRYGIQERKDVDETWTRREERRREGTTRRVIGESKLSKLSGLLRYDMI